MPLSNAKAQIEAIKAGLDCPMGNPQLPGNVYIFASFQEEVDDLLFAAGESCCPDVPGLFSKQDFFRYDQHFAEKFDVAELECLRIDFQLGIRVLRRELKFNIDLRLELCLRTANELQYCSRIRITGVCFRFEHGFRGVRIETDKTGSHIRLFRALALVHLAVLPQVRTRTIVETRAGNFCSENRTRRDLPSF